MVHLLGANSIPCPEAHMVMPEVPCGRVTDPKEHPPVECLLSVDESESSELQTEQATLVDDEELELNELQAGPNPLRCSAHLSSTGRHGCPLCKDLLARFPPPSVRMKQPFPTKPWESSPEMVKKLFQEKNQMVKYGLRPRTLKGELFALLSKKGSSGLKVSELAKSPQIIDLNLSGASEVEQLIFSTLSSDITLFEKIAPSAYRLRVDPRIKGKEDPRLDTEDSGTVDDDGDASSSGDESVGPRELSFLEHGSRIADDPGHRRVYFESSEDGHWEVIDSPQVVHLLWKIKGQLRHRLHQPAGNLLNAPSAIVIEVGRRSDEKILKWERICHSTFEVGFDLEERYAIHVATCREPEGLYDVPNHKVLPSQLQALKAAIHAIEARMPAAAFAGLWMKSSHKLWVKRLRRTSSLPELLQVLNDFVGAIDEDWLYQSSSTVSFSPYLDDVTVYFQTMPQTTSAVALWVVKLDALIAPYLVQS
ncbi:hypothetical protein ACQ4PT_045348 [Festuca glaucescens]